MNHEKLSTWIRILSAKENRFIISLEFITKESMPITPEKMGMLSHLEIAALQIINDLFAETQDDIEKNIFPLILAETKIADDETLTYIDKLNLLEKHRWLTRAAWWQQLRKLYHETADPHDDSDKTAADHTQKVITASIELLEYWDFLQPKLLSLQKNISNQN